MIQTVIVSSAPSAEYLYAKRACDLVASIVLIALLAPLLILIAFVIRADSPGPALFIQERVGSRPQRSSGRIAWVVRTFRVYKFRTMYRGVDESAHINHISAYVRGVAHHDGRQDAKAPNDTRVTRVGRILRKTSLDELPQLINVIKGEMSLVGPRPVPEYEVDLYSEHDMQRFAAVPGITGLWQVNGRCSLTYEQQIALDIDYTERQSFWLDFVILLRTIPAVLFGRGAE